MMSNESEPTGKSPYCPLKLDWDPSTTIRDLKAPITLVRIFSSSQCCVELALIWQLFEGDGPIKVPPCPESEVFGEPTNFNQPLGDESWMWLERGDDT